MVNVLLVLKSNGISVNHFVVTVLGSDWCRNHFHQDEFVAFVEHFIYAVILCNFHVLTMVV